DRVVGGLREHDRRELDHAALRDLPEVERLGELARCLEPEVGGNSVFEARTRSAPVLAAGSSVHRGEAEVLPSAPVAGDLAERRKAGVPSVRRDADAVDAGAAGDGDAPAALGPCT